MSESQSPDPILNVVQKGIKGDIRALLEEERLRGALLLTLAGIDTMAFLGMEKGKTGVSRSDYVEWADQYIEFQCSNQVSGLELYAARCAALHNYSTESRLSREGDCREIGWMSESTPAVRYNSEVREDLVLVSIPALSNCFFEGVDAFLVDVYSDDQRAEIADERFQKIMHTRPVSED